MFDENIQKVLDIASGILCCMGFVPYIASTIRSAEKPEWMKPIFWTILYWIALGRKSKPERATWIIWFILDGIALWGMCMKGTQNGLIIGSVAGAFLTMLFALYYGTNEWKLSEILCLVGAAIALFVWWLMNDAFYGIIISLSVMTFGSIFTLTHVWEKPEEEHPVTWILFSLSSLLGVLAVQAWTWEAATQPCVFLGIEVTITTLLFLRLYQKKQ